MRPAAADRPKVLLVDDDPPVLDGLRRQVRQHFAVSTATDGPTALDLLAAEDFAVVLSDMRMPGMDGAQLLARFRQAAPDTVRMLLTGQADMDAAVSAINDGQIFRFLTKPCPPELLLSALQDGAKLHRLAVAERDLLDKTLRGAVQALCDALALAQPQAFARAQRIARTVRELAAELGVGDRWEVDLAAMLAQLGAVSLPPGVLDKLDRGLPLAEEERPMVARVPALSAQIVAAIPRLEHLAAAIGNQGVLPDPRTACPDTDPALDLIPRMLKVAADFDFLTCGRLPAATAIRQLRDREGSYDPKVLAALELSQREEDDTEAPVEIPLEELTPGMIIAVDILTDRGALLVGRGTVATEAMVRRLRNHCDSEAVSARLLVFNTRV